MIDVSFLMRDGPFYISEEKEEEEGWVVLRLFGNCQRPNEGSRQLPQKNPAHEMSDFEPWPGTLLCLWQGTLTVPRFT